MPTTAEATRRASVNRQIMQKTIRKAFLKINDNALGALDDVGKIAVRHAKDTHTFQNKTFRLEKSYAYAVVPAGGTRSIESPEEIPVMVKSDDGVHTLVFGALAPYALFVEVKHGFDVAIQTFLMVRREGRKMIEGRLKARKLQ